jgi:hypothetical protein
MGASISSMSGRPRSRLGRDNVVSDVAPTSEESSPNGVIRSWSMNVKLLIVEAIEALEAVHVIASEAWDHVNASSPIRTCGRIRVLHPPRS